MFARILETYRRAFAGLPREVWHLALVTVVHRSGTMVLPFLSLYVTQDLGLTARHAGAALALYGVGTAIGSYLGGRLSDRLGPMRAQVASLAAAGVGFPALAAARPMWPLAIALVLVAAAVESFRPSNAAALASVAPEAVRYRAFALRRLAINVGMTLGPAAGGLLATYDYLWLFICDGGTCLAAAAVLWVLFHNRAAAPTDETAASAGAERGSPWRDGPFVALVFLVTAFTMVFFQLLSTYPLTLHDVFGMRERTIGLLLAINTLLIVMFEMVLVHAIDRFNPIRVAAVGVFLTCAGLGALPLGSSVTFVCLTIVVWTFGEMLSHPMLEGVAASRGPAASRGAYLGLYSATFGAAFVLSPVIGTWVYDGLGYRALWFGCLALGVVLGAGFWALSGWYGKASGTESTPGAS
jgi:predicted MFS family arabinose efflux permease